MIRQALVVAAFTAILTGLAGCPEDEPGPTPTPDVVTADTPDQDATADATPDAVPDAAPDAVPDAVPDATPDAVPDATPDAVADATDASADGDGSSGGDADAEVDAGPAPTTLEKAVAAVGGEAALLALASFQVTATGTAYRHDQGQALGDAATESGTYTSTLSYAVASGSLRIDYERSMSYLGGLPLSYSEVVVGDLGVVDGTDGIFLPTGDMLSSRVASTKKTVMLAYPHLLFLAILADPSIVSEGADQMLDGVPHEVLIVQDAVAPIELWFDASTGTLSKLVTLENDHLRRDSALEATYTNWSSSDGDVMFPLNVTITLNGEPVTIEARSLVAENPTLDPTTFDFPAGASPTLDGALQEWGAQSSQYHQMWVAAGIPLDNQELAIVPTELAPGVWHLTGASHNSLIVEQEFGLVLVEAPLYPKRSEAIIQWSQTQFGGKGISHVISTHHHADSSAGLREMVVFGSTIVAASVDSYAQIFGAASTVQPDTLANNPSTPVLEDVSSLGTFTLDDLTNPVTAYNITNSHASDMLIVHVAGANILFQTDLYNPGGGGSSLNPLWAQELLDAITAEGLTVDFLAGGHAGVAPLAELQAYVQP